MARIRGSWVRGVLPALLVFSAGAAWAATVDWIAAKVNDEIILYSEVEERAKALGEMSAQHKAATPEKKREVEKQVLQAMIRDRLAQSEVKRLKISVTDKEVTSTLQAIMKENNLNESQFDYVLRQQGMAPKDFKEKIRKDLQKNRLVDRVVESKIVVTDAQVDEYLKSGSGSAQAQAAAQSFHLAVILIPAPDGQKADAQVKLAREIREKLGAGGDFAALARQHSKGPAAEQGGDIGFIELDDLSTEVRTAVRGKKAGEVTDVVRASGGLYIVKVLDAKKSAPATTASAADPNFREKVRRQLLDAEVNVRYEKWMKEVEAKCYVEVNLDPPGQGGKPAAK